MKSLGPKGAKLIHYFLQKGIPVFTLAEAQEITKTDYKSTAELVSYLRKKEWLIKIKAGKYAIAPVASGRGTYPVYNWLLIARELVSPYPYYISHYSALSLHNMTIHPVIGVYLSSPHRFRKPKIPGVDFRFICCAKKKLWGREETWVSKQEKVWVSEIERTILDCLARPDLCGGLSELAQGLWMKRNQLDYNKLTRAAHKLGINAVSKRLGFLLELFDLGKTGIPALKSQIKNSLDYVSLDPTLPRRGKYLSKWRLLVNSEPEELRRLIRT